MKLLRTCLFILALSIGYFGSAKLGFALGTISGFAALFWIPSGLSVSALFLGGLWLAPGVFLGAFLANITNGAPPLVAFLIGTGNMLEALVGAYLLKRLDVDPTFSKFSDVLQLTFIAALATNVSVVIGISSLWIGHSILTSAIQAAKQAWWIGDALSILLITPFALAISTWLQQKLARRKETA